MPFDDPYTAVEISTAPGWDDDGQRVERWAVLLRNAYGTRRVLLTPNLEVAVAAVHDHMRRIEMGAGRRAAA